MVTGYFLHLGKMKIVRVLPSGKVVLCSDTSRVNRGEVYYLEQEYVYRVMPCVFFHLNGNSRRLALQSPARVRLFANENLVLDELIRS